MRSILLLIVSFLFLAIDAQKGVNYSQTDKIAVLVPDSLSKSTDGIAFYISSHFTTQDERARAAFIWIAKNIQYDIENCFAINFYQNSSEIVADVMKTRKGVCMHFAALFADLAVKTGLNAVVVTGYTKQNGFVDYIPHAWCAVKIDTAWALIDPTWGSGYVQNAKFIRQVNNFYFRPGPELLIRSHIPFDPMWELLNYTVTNQEFYQGITQANTSKPFFAYNDSIRVYLNGSELDKLISASRRTEANGIRNSMIFDRVQHNKREIEYYINRKNVEKQNLAIDAYNEAVILVNDGINKLNQFIEYRNHQFNPKRTDDEIRSMLIEPERLFGSADLKLNSIQSTDQNLEASILQLNKSLNEATYNLNEQRTFLNKYFSTGKAFRKSLFYRYTWMGIPLGK